MKKKIWSYPLIIIGFVLFLTNSCKKDNSTPSNNNTGGTGNQSLTAPTLSIPTNGAINLWVPITFSWSVVPNATSYDIQALYYGVDGHLTASFAHANVTNNSFTTGSNYIGFHGKTIYWYVIAKNSSTTGPSSAMWSFTLQN